MTTRFPEKRLVVVEKGTWAETAFQIDDSSDFNLGKLGQYFRVLRTRKGLSMRALSRESGVSQSYVSMIESGSESGPPSLKILKRLGEYFQIQVDTFLLVGGMKALPPDEGDVDPGLGLNLAFEQMMMHERLCPPALEKDDLDWLSPKTRRAWVLFAVRLHDAGVAGDPSVAELMENLRRFEPPSDQGGQG